MNSDLAQPPFVRRPDIRSHDPIIAFRIMPSKNAKILRTGVPRRPLAFNGDRWLAATAPDKVDFVILLVPPIANLFATLGNAVNFVQHKVLPERSFIIRAQAVPSSEIGHEAGVKAVHLWGGDDFGGLMR